MGEPFYRLPYAPGATPGVSTPRAPATGACNKFEIVSSGGSRGRCPPERPPERIPACRVERLGGADG